MLAWLVWFIRAGVWSFAYALVALSTVVDVVGQVDADPVAARGKCARARWVVAAAAVRDTRA